MASEAGSPPPALAVPATHQIIDLQQQRALAAHQARLLASKKPLGSGASLRAGATAARPDSTRKGSIQKKRKQGNIRLSDKVRALIPSSALLFELQAVEQRVDALLARKKGELQDMQASFRRGVPGSSQASGTIRRRLRIYAFTEHFHQPSATTNDGGVAGESRSAQLAQVEHASSSTVIPSNDTNSGTVPGATESTTTAHAPPPPTMDQPSWALHIQGRLLTAGEDAAGTGAAAPAGRLPFTHYVRRLTVKLDTALYPGSSGSISWEHSRHDLEDRESFVVRRAGSKPTTAVITLEVNHVPPLYKPSPALATLLGLEGLHSLPYILQMLWGYVKKHHLFEATPQSPMVRCDEALQAVTGKSMVSLSALQETVRSQVTPPDPVTFEVPIPLKGASPSQPVCYDVLMEVPLNAALPAWSGPDERSVAELETHDSALAAAVEAAGESARRRSFLLGFAASPVDAIDRLIAAQARDLRVAVGGDALEVLPPSQTYTELWVQDASLRVMGAHPSKGRAR